MKSKIILTAFIVIIFLLGIMLGVYVIPKNKTFNEQNKTINTVYKDIKILGVDQDGKGVSAIMNVEVKPGSGLVLVNINNLLADYLTQLSARNAAKAASNFTKINLSSFDIVYSIKTSVGIIEGPSAGAAMAAATIAALSNRTVNGSVFITGSIESNGSIGSVGGINEKAQAAKDSKALLFLIPEARYNVGYEVVKKCKNIKDINYCELTYLPKKFELSELLNLDIIQVKNIDEAVKYILI